MLKFGVTQNGKPLDTWKYTWDAETKTFSTNEGGLIIDATGITGITFKTGGLCTFVTGSLCTFITGGNCTFRTGSSCVFVTSISGTFETGDECTFTTGAYCTFKTGYNCTFKTYCECTFDTGSRCTFKTDTLCTFKTGNDCTFDISGIGSIDAQESCVLIRRDLSLEAPEVTDVSNKQLTTAPYGVKGYVASDGFYYIGEEKQYKAIIEDGVLYEVVPRTAQ